MIKSHILLNSIDYLINWRLLASSTVMSKSINRYARAIQAPSLGYYCYFLTLKFTLFLPILVVIVISNVVNSVGAVGVHVISNRLTYVGNICYTNVAYAIVPHRELYYLNLRGIHLGTI